jgi:hypothetical protein
LISRLIYKDWKINIDSKRQLLDLEENLYQYRKDSEADPYFGKAYCFGIDKHWVWENMTGAGRDWELKMEKFEKAFMIINFRDLILFNYQILNKELYDKYKHLVKPQVQRPEALDVSMDSIDMMAHGGLDHNLIAQDSITKDVDTPIRVRRRTTSTLNADMIDDTSNVMSPSPSPFPDKKFFDGDSPGRADPSMNEIGEENFEEEILQKAAMEIIGSADFSKLEKLKAFPRKNGWKSSLWLRLAMLIGLINMFSVF